MVFRIRNRTTIAPAMATAPNPGDRVFMAVVVPAVTYVADGIALLFSMAEEKDCVLPAEMVTGTERS